LFDARNCVPESGAAHGARARWYANRSREPSKITQVYLVPAGGSLLVNGEPLGTGDGMALGEVPRIDIEATENAEVVMVEVR
jgi:hypothetical protein